MSKDKREPDYPTELETQFILRLPVEPAKELRELIANGDSMKNRLTIQVDSFDMRKGEVKLDQRTMHAKIVDLPTIVESMKTIDNKSFYKTADICQMMVCKEEPDQVAVEEELPAKNKKKDPYKVDKKFLFPHGITPPTKNVRKRRFRKTLKKKCAEAPEIEKEVKRLLRADNEAESITFEIINEEDEQLFLQKHDTKPGPSTSQAGNVKTGKKGKAGRNTKGEVASTSKKPATSDVVDIFGGAVSDSDLEDESNISKNIEGANLIPPSQAKLMKKSNEKPKNDSLEFDPQMFGLSHDLQSKVYASDKINDGASTSQGKTYDMSFDEEEEQSRDSKDSMTVRIEQVRAELEELKERRKRTQHEIAGMENLALRQRFLDTLHTLNQEVMFKEMEYQGLLTLQNSEDI